MYGEGGIGFLVTEDVGVFGQHLEQLVSKGERMRSLDVLPLSEDRE